MSSAISIGIFILIFLMALAIPVLIGVFVYRDAKKRNMNAVLWTLIAVLAPTFIGLIIYLIVRADHSPLQCPSCSEIVTDRYTVCPKCGAKLKLTCDKCGFPVEPQWHICPNCAEPLPENQKRPLPAPVNDKGLVGILIAVILISIALCIILTLAFLAPLGGGSSGSYSSSMFTGNLNKAELCKVDAVKSWLSDCDQTGDGIYVLVYKSKEYKTQTYLIYRKGAANMADTQINSSSEGFFRKPVNILTYSALGESNAVGYDISYLFLFGEPGELKIRENGSDAAYSIIESNVNWPEMISAYISEPDLNEPDLNEPASIEIQNSTSIPIYSVSLNIYNNVEILETQVVQDANNTALKKDERVSFMIYPASFNDADILDYDLTIYDANENIIITNKFIAERNKTYQFIIDYDANGNVILVPVN